ncbi:DMT family transporter [Glutamicibacter halophytocola]|uniref:DMT family transporter n=1 Tax=Glutamicibacter halophytocola TaxID=1933880 RepID=A0AA95BRV9_9MICC|nr:DMT family transporter [Glutamicibacter halophytocola]UUX58947.1 DMT family transporter [Glutamicibacter halophytocola]
MHSEFRWRVFSRQEAVLVLATVVWGATFLIIHIAVQYSGPWFFVGMRFITAGLISALLFVRILKGLTLREIWAGVAIGVMIFLGYGLQTAGLQTLNSSTSAFISALYVPLVPLLQWVVFRKRPGMLTWVGVTLAFIGLILLADPGSVGFTFGTGEIVTIASTVPIALEIILIGWFAGKVHLGRVTVVQLLVAGFLGFLAVPLAGEQVPEFSWVWVIASVGLGLASCMIQLAMNWAQKSVSPTKATIIYAGEPVWAALIGRIAGDRLPPVAIVGAMLIVAGSLASELRPRRRRKTVTSTDVLENAGH